MKTRTVLLALILTVSGGAVAQASARPNLITVPVDSTRTVVMAGNVHPLAQLRFDAGEAPQSQPMNRMMLVLGRSNAQEQTLENLLAEQQNPTSLQFHQWVSPQQFGTLFGLSDSDVNAVIGWLSSQGFTDIHVNAGRTVVEFSGTVQTVETAFSVSIHHYKVSGKEYSANTTDPHLPEALAPAVLGIVTLHNFPRHPQSHVLGAFTHESGGRVHPAATTGAQPLTTIPDGTAATYYGVSPYDFATIYNLLPLWTASSPVDGTGQALAIVGQTDINPQDFITFRNLFGLPIGAATGNSGTQYLNIIHNGQAPGILTDGEETEADLDTQWSSSVAPHATIDFVVSATTETAQGIDLSTEYIIDNNLAPVMSTSYGNCEYAIGTAGNAFYNSIYQQASAQGITVITSAGDSGPAGCDEAGGYMAIYGLAVSGMTSTPYNVSAGGTDFYMPNGGSSYWNTTNSSTTKASALSYIPEVPWNNSCGNTVLSSTTLFSSETPLQACNNAFGWYAPYDYLTNVGGGGGASSCTQPTGTSVTNCSVPYPKPAWQTGPGVPSDGVRDVPDISLFSGNGRYNAFYIVCEADYPLASGGCTLNISQAGEFNFVALGGTSAAAPAFAGVMALVNQQTGSRQGNANYVLYSLAAHQTGSCSAASNPASSCIFNDVTTGSNIIPCEPSTPNCTVPSSTYNIGVLPGYTTNTGYDQASGLGSVNVTNLVRNWTSATRTATTTSLQLTPTTAVHGTGIAAVTTVTSSGTTPTGQVSFNGNAPNGSDMSGTLTNGQLQQTLNALPGGTYSVTAHYAGDTTHGSSDSSPVSVTISPEPSVEQIALYSNVPSYGIYSAISGYTAPYGTLFDIRTSVTGKSGNGLATGTITTTDNGTAIATSVPISSSGSADAESMLPAGTHTLGISYSGDPSFNAGSTTQQVSVTPMPMECNITSNSTIIRQGWNLQVDASSEAIPNVSGAIFYVANGVTAIPTGTMSVYEGSTLIYGPAAITGRAGAPPVSSGGATSFTIPSSYNSYNVPAAQISYPLQPITISYSGDASFSSCTSAALPLTLQSGPITSEVNTYWNNEGYPTPAGTTPNFTIGVQPISYPPNNDPYTPPTGTITVVLDGAVYGSPLALAIIPGNSTLYPTVNFSLPTTGLSLGDHNLTFNYSGDSNYSPASGPGYQIDLVGPSFSLYASPYSVTVTNGSTTNPITVNVNPLYNFTGTVSFSCSGLPNEAACIFSPATVNTSGNTTLTITTTRASVIHSTPQSAQIPMRSPLPTSLGTLAAGVLAMLSLRRRKIMPRLLAVMLALIAFSAVTSCGGGGSTGGGTSQPSGPTATYTNLFASNYAPTENTLDTFTANVSNQGGATAPTGNVIFYVDNSSTGTSEPLSGSVASFTQTFANAGAHTVTAAYQGDTSHVASTSSTAYINVKYANGSIPGTYNITVTGTSGTITQSTQFALTVQ